MNYNLAKQLKDAGFPQFGTNYVMPGDIPLVDLKVPPTQEYPYVPTLSELIEACGKCNFILADVESHWNASGYCKDTYYIKQSETPEEAVAKLWLELNKCS